ncbi:MAG: 4Fe-4S binding protein [Desulfovibrionales bacterium]
MNEQNAAPYIVNQDEFPTSRPVAHIRRDRCDGCGFCTEVCPTDALKIVPNRERGGKKVAFLTPKLCEGCGVCQATCPKDAIFIPGLSNSDLSRFISLALE